MRSARPSGATPRRARAISAGLLVAGAALYGACSPEPLGQGLDGGTDATGVDGGRDAAKPSLCVDGKPSPYPPATKIDLFATVPALEFPKLGGGTFSLASRYNPCAPRSKLLLLRTTAAFCGTCLWAQRHTQDVIPKGLEDRVELVDLVVSDKNNVLVHTSDDLARMEAELGPHAATVAADPAYRFQSVGLGDRRLPFYVLVDSRTMLVRRFVPDPEPEMLDSMVRRELALLDGQTPPLFADVKYADGLFPTNHFDLLREMTLPGPPPKDPTNAVADSAVAAALGKELFSDTRLSPSGTVACATCHAPDKGFADARPRGRGVTEGDRNTPSVLYASHARFQFWDGRADTLWLQALGPLRGRGRVRLQSALHRTRDRGLLQSTLRRGIPHEPAATARRPRALPRERQTRRPGVGRDGAGRQGRGQSGVRASRQSHRGVRAHSVCEGECHRPLCRRRPVGPHPGPEAGTPHLLHGRLRAMPLRPAPHG
ncbi:MAG: cytochrome-c peroxidase [Myxococcales bacterium]|nr:cytochrome-c peroxidase [Myxococcales bacterium]